jgi:hypothetical protein
MESISHEYIVKFIKGFVNDNNIDDSLNAVIIFSEYCKNGDVY